MSDLQDFVRASSGGAEGNLSLVLTGPQQDVTTRSRWHARFVERFRFAENRNVTARFMDGLKRNYGTESARAVAESSGLHRTLSLGKPLRIRQVRLAIADADLTKRSNQIANIRLADRYSSMLRMENPLTSGVRPMFEDIVNSRYGGDSGVTRLVDRGRLAELVHAAILDEGLDGEHGICPVHPQRADDICRSIVERELHAAYAAARDRALSTLDPRRPGSIMYRELANAFGARHPPVVLSSDKLSADAVQYFNGRFAHAIDSGHIRADELDDEATLREIAGETVNGFMAERDAARARVGELTLINAAERKALLEQVTCDTIPENLVAPLGNTYFLVRDELPRISCNLTPVELKDSINTLVTGTANTGHESGIRLDTDNADQAYRHAWRFILAPGGRAQAKAILGQLAPGQSHLRRICEAADWYANSFKQTSEAMRTLGNDGPGPEARVHDDESFELANRCWKTLLALAAVATEKAGPQANWGNAFTANPNPADLTVTTLRDIGIPFPATDRLGRANDDVLLSRPALASMQEAIDRKVAETPDLHDSGLTKDCVKFLRANELTTQREAFKARFAIEGNELPRQVKARQVVKELKAFCTGPDGTVNAELLANVSRMINHDTFNCLYSGCMNPARPDLSIMNGYPKGVMEGHSYWLWRETDREVRLGVSERITPLMLYPMVPIAGLVTPDGRPEDAALQGERLSGHNSDFRIRAIIRFTPGDYKPRLHSVELAYCLAPGDPDVAEPPYWIEQRGSHGTPRLSAGSDRATPAGGNTAAQGGRPDSLETEAALEYELMHPAIPVHRTRTPPQPRGT